MAETFLAPEADELLETSPFEAPVDEAVGEEEAAQYGFEAPSRLESAAASLTKPFAQIVPNLAAGTGQAMKLLNRLNPVGQSIEIGKQFGVPGAQEASDVIASPGKALETLGSEASEAIDASPAVNPAYQEEWLSAKIPNVIGQAGAQLAATALPGRALGLGASGMTALGLSEAGLLGLNSGYKEADRIGVSDPVKRDIFAVLMGGIEAGSERLTGFGTPSYSRMLSGEIRDILEGSALKTIGKSALGEGLEEVAAEIPQNLASTVFSENDQPLKSINPLKLDYWANLAEVYGLGAIGGTVFGGVQAVANRKTPAAALAMRSAVADHREEIEAKMAAGQPLTPQEAQELDELKSYDERLGSWLEEQGIDGNRQRTGLATAKGIQSATRAGLPAAAEALRKAAREAVLRQQQAKATPPPFPKPVETSKAPDPAAAQVESQLESVAEEGILSDVIAQERAKADARAAREAGVAEQPFIPPADEALTEPDAQIPAEEVVVPKLATETPPEMAQEVIPPVEQPLILDEEAPAPQIDSQAPLQEQEIVPQETEILPTEATTDETQVPIAQDQPVAEAPSLPVLPSEPVVDVQPSVETPGSEVTPSFEQNLRQTITSEGLKWLESDIRAAVKYQQSKNPNDLQSGVRRKVVARVEQAMQSPEQTAEQEADELLELRKIKDDIQHTRNTTDPIKNSDPALVKWADGVVEEGELNAGLNPRLLTAHAVRAAWWIKQNGEDFAKWSSEQIARFGESIRAHLQKIWDTALKLNVEGEQVEKADRTVSPRPTVPVAFKGWQDLDAMDAKLQADVLDEAWASFHTAGVRNGQSEEEIVAAWTEAMTDPESTRISSALEQIRGTNRPSNEAVRYDVKHEGESGSEIIDTTTGQPVKFSISGRGRVLTRGASEEDVQSALKALSPLLPNIQTAWIGTRADLNAHLKADKTFQKQWKDQWMADNAGSTSEQSDESFDKFVSSGLNRAEGFIFHGKTYLITDQVAVFDTDKSATNAVRRVLVHEDAHEGLQHLRAMDDKVNAEWLGLRKQIDASELDKLATSDYPWLAGWRNDESKHDQLAEEWFAARVTEAEMAGTEIPADSLLGKFVQWLKNAIKQLLGTEQDITNEMMLDFIRASRVSRFRSRAEANVRGMRFSNALDGNIPPENAIPIQLGQDWQKAPERLPYDLWSKERRDMYEEFQKSPDITPEMRMFTQFLGKPTENQRIRQELRPMVDQARAKVGGINGQSANVNPENTETAWALVKAMLSRKSFAKQYRDEFVRVWSDRGSDGKALHLGDAAVTVLQMELADYAVRLAAETGDIRMWMLLQRTVNDTILSDYQTMSGAARVLQVRSAASQQSGAWTSLRLAAQSAQKAAQEMVGEQEAADVAASVESKKNPELYRDVLDQVDTSLDSKAGQELEARVNDTSEEYESDGYFQRVLDSGLLDAEEMELAARYDRHMARLDQLLQLQDSLTSRNQIKASMVEDRILFANDPEALKKAIAAEVAAIKEILPLLNARETSAESKAKRQKRGKATSRARKALSLDDQAKKLIERYENREKRTRKDKPAWRKTFDEQVRSPISEPLFVAKMEEYGMSEPVAEKLFELTQELSAERKARRRARAAASTATKTPAKPPVLPSQRDAESIINSYAKSFSDTLSFGSGSTPSPFRELQQRYLDKKIDRDQFLSGADKMGVKSGTATRVADLTEEAQKRSETVKKAKDEQAKLDAAEKEATKYEREAQRIIEASSKEPDSKAKSQLRELLGKFMRGEINEQEFRNKASALSITDETLETLVDVTNREIEAREASRAAKKAAKEATAEEDRLKKAFELYAKKVTGTYSKTDQEALRELKRDLKDSKITEAEFEAEKVSRKLKEPEPKLTDVRGFIGTIAREILDAPIEMQEDPTWRRDTIIRAFIERGMSQDNAENAADTLSGIIDRALREGQARAALKALKNLKKSKKYDAVKIAEAIRSRGFDPTNPNPAITALAKEAGYNALTHEQFVRLAKLDQLIQNSGFHLAAKHYTEMEQILSTVRPRKGWMEIITQSWINSALSSIGVVSLNWAHPTFIMIRRIMPETALLFSDVMRGKTKPVEAAEVWVRQMEHWFHAFETWAAEAKFALKNDAYANQVLEVLSGTHRMRQEMLDGLKEFRTGTRAQKVKGAIKIALTSTDLMRRVLASADQTWGSVIGDMVSKNEALRLLMQKGGLSPSAAGIILDRAVTAGKNAQVGHLGRGGDATEALLVGKDAMQLALSTMVGETLGDVNLGDEVVVMGRKEAEMEIGNRQSEDGAWFDFVNGMLELFKTASSGIRRTSPLFGRVLTGFITVGANILNRSAYFTPLGIARAVAKMKSDPAVAKKIYTETMATEGQVRMRMIEGIVGTLGMMLLAMLRQDSDDEEGFVITGDGPDNRSLKDAWQKAGHKPAHLEWVGKDGKVKFSISYTRGGLDHLAMPLTFVGALDDLQLDGKKMEKKTADSTWAYLETVVGNLANQARFFGMKNLLSTAPTSTSQTSIAKNLTYPFVPLIPWSGLMKSVTRLSTGPQDQTSWKSAMLAQLPIIPAFSGRPARNFLGDEIGTVPRDLTTKVAERLEGAGFPFLFGLDVTPKDSEVYEFLVSKGAAPSAPSRGELESANGFITDDRWESYVRARGSAIKQGIMKERNRIQFMERSEAQDAMSQISREATLAIKKKMRLS